MRPIAQFASYALMILTLTVTLDAQQTTVPEANAGASTEASTTDRSEALSTTLPAPPASRSTRPTIAVLNFDDGTVKEQWPTTQIVTGRGTPAMMPTFDSLDVGTGIASLMVGELVDGGELRLIERQRLADVAREGQGGETVRARYLVLGTVTKFGGEEKIKAGFGLAVGLISHAAHLPLAGGLSMKDTVSHVDLSARIVDTTTGEIVGTASGTGQSKRKGFLLGGTGSGSNRFAAGGLKVDSADFKATILGEATVEAVKDAAQKIKTLLTALTQSR
jgi:curli biogenesis system outer membrane secretion channel CsgG